MRDTQVPEPAALGQEPPRTCPLAIAGFVAAFAGPFSCGVGLGFSFAPGAGHGENVSGPRQNAICDLRFAIGTARRRGDNAPG